MSLLQVIISFETFSIPREKQELRKINKKNKTTGFLQDLVTSIVKGTKSKQDEILSKDIESNSDWLEIQAAAAAVLTALGVLAAALRSGYNR